MEQNQENASVQQTEAHEQITLTWENVTFRVPIKDKRILEEPHNFSVVNVDGKPLRTIVENLTGYARPNELIGLLGPSGGGKTVLMNIFSSRLSAPSGSEYNRNVYVNNKVPLTREVFGKVAAYVMQDDVLLETLTPHECLQFAANLRLSGTPEEREERVQKIIKDLRLTTCKDTLVGNVLKKGISGGERKRTSIGVELITDPSLIILDG
jgi:ABC-type multidrug transport system ATPase subunit